jgi:quercetin dioxygenase-like cupin family protein
MNTVNIKDIKKIVLPKRDVKVLIGNNSPINSLNMTFGVATILPKTSMDPHIHNKEEEIIYILSGYGYVDIDGEKEKIEEGTVIKLPIGSKHYLCNNSNVEMNFTFCFNSPIIIGTYDKK